MEIMEVVEAMEPRELFAAKERFRATTVTEAPTIRGVRTRRDQSRQHY
jgi:hypothetical protein